MAAQKKFGTFSGVLTPSLLTILGVIMYMRLGSVVGNSSGIVQVILIIVFAHLISITTGLSVSSISTDKKIEKGGIYYMLTRSLGLPIGGAIGLTIFIATAFSISLYLIGFAESLIPVLNSNFGIGQISINKLRLFGTLALSLVAVIAYVSTSFALKIQYVILGLIVLSLGSIFLGSSEGLQKGNDVINAPSFSVLFGIFFPAVTGFTAGVAMSGDLKNPRLSIPWGTMTSILIGLTIYIILAVFIYYNIDAEILKSNNNVLIEFGAVSILVIGGVWGATLSSALGGILGGPRILQAMSLDNITPKAFAKGYGLNNEPRNALFLTFIIAEIGILIGELNVIAELVAMFYMAAYLFINISCFLEQWSSPDFRPKFKIPIWISLIGAIATFLLMIQLNLAATLFAILIMLIIWFWLSRKDLVLGTGDVWFSVWTSIVRTGLKNLQKKAVHRRNWQPNILLFSGGSNNRPHLIEFGKSISGRGGMVSNFDLIKDEKSNALFSKPHQIVKDNLLNDDSIFHRRLYCQNIFKGIETIANTYGFSGIDPNTVLMGWARNTNDPIYFGQMTQKLIDLDYNILYLDFDEKRGFGNYNEISLWWSNINKENELGLQLVKFLKSSLKWNNSSLTIYYINNLTKSGEEVKKIIETTVEKKRIRADIKIINNYIEKKEVNELIRSRSYSSDLILMNLPLLVKGKEKSFINASNLLFKDIGSALFIEASSNFRESSIVSRSAPEIKELSSETYSNDNSKPTLIKTYDLNYDSKNIDWQNDLIIINDKFYNDLQKTIAPYFNFYANTLSPLSLKEELVSNLFNTEELNLITEEFENNFNNNIEDYFLGISHFTELIPKKFKFNYSKNFLSGDLFNKSYDSNIKLKKLEKSNNEDSTLSQKINLFKLFDHHFKNEFIIEFHELLKMLGEIQLKLYHQYKLFLSNNIEGEFKKHVEKLGREVFDTFKTELNKLSAKLLNAIVVDIGKNNIKRLIIDREELFDPKSYRVLWQPIEEFSASFAKNTIVFHNHKVMCCTSLILTDLANQEISNIKTLFINNVFKNYLKFINDLFKKIESKKSNDLSSIFLEIEGQLSKTIRDIDQYNSSKNIEFEIDQFPIELDVYSLEIINEFRKSQSALLEKTYYLQATLKSIYNQGVDSKIKQIIHYNKEWLRKEIEELIAAIKLLSFTKENQKSPILIKEVEDKLSLKIDDFKTKLSNYKERFLVDISDLNAYLKKLSNEDFLLQNNSKRVVELSQNNKGSLQTKFNIFQEKLSEYFLKFINYITPEDNLNLQYSNSDKLLELRKFMSNCSVSKSIDISVSELYLQLFNYKIQPNSFFSSFISDQLITSKKLMSDFSFNNQNVILVTGAPQSGKSYLMDQLSSYYKDENCYVIDPPIDFKIQPVEKSVKKLIHKINSPVNNQFGLEDLPEGSFVFIYDFEMWWRKNEEGFYAVNSWLEVFKKFLSKIVFIVEINELLKDHLLMTTTIDQSIVKLINTKTFNSKQIQEITEEKARMSDQNIYSTVNRINFKKLTKIVNGNIGWFNSIWLSSLSVNNGTLEMIPDYDLTFPNFFNDLELSILLQFYWHKRINIDNVESYFPHISSNKLNEVLSFFKSEKLLIASGNTMEINFFITPYLKLYLVTNNYIS